MSLMRKLVASTLFTISLIVTVQENGALAASPVDCAQYTNGMQKELPVLFAHGFLGNEDVWGDVSNPSSALSTMKSKGMHAVPFDYSPHAGLWVTNENIGPKLAATISCLADASKQNGGPGKVAIVAHSMGGLAAQYAAAQVPDKVDHMVTIATPFKGSELGNVVTAAIRAYCQNAFLLGLVYRELINQSNCASALAFGGLSVGSKELKELPPLPGSVTVKAIAGNVTPQMQIGPVTLTGESLDSDTMVRVPSALAASTNTGRGDGAKVISCTGFVVLPLISDAPCEHGRLVNHPEVQQEVKASLEQYMASLKPSVPTTDIYGMLLPLEPEWEVSRNPELATRSRTVLFEAPCNSHDLPPSCDVIVVVNTSGPENMEPYGDPNDKARGFDCYSPKLHNDMMFGHLESAGEVDFGGERAQIQILKGCNFHNSQNGPRGGATADRLYIWRFPSRGVLVFAVVFDGDYATMSRGRVENLLHKASWR